MTNETKNSEAPCPLKWHGGRNAFRGKLARWIIALMPPHLHYGEPFAGGLAVLLGKKPVAPCLRMSMESSGSSVSGSGNKCLKNVKYER